KTTIYRRYVNRDEIIEKALEAQTVTPCVPEGLCVYDRVKWTLEVIRRGLSSDMGMGSVSAVLTDQDPDLTESFREVINARSNVVADVLRAAVDSGAVRAVLDVDTSVTIPVGAYLGADLLS